MQLSPGDRLGPYEILAAIGKGGMGEVWQARDTRLNRDVAVKVSAQQFTDRFEREAQAIAALNHPNICTLHDVGPSYLVMEFIEGPTLAERITQGPVPLEEALAIARQIADALEAAHDKGIVHRDLKPANIKVRPDGSVKVLDFGLAKSDPAHAVMTSDSPTLLSVSGIILGTAGYMSPEQAKGKEVDKRADIFAFGAVLYEMVTGRRSFEGETISETLAAVIKDEPDLSTAPPRVQRVLRRCLEKDPRKRLRDISIWSELLEEPEPSTAEVPLVSPVLKVRFRIAWATAVTLAVIAAASSWLAWRGTRPVERSLMRFTDQVGGAVFLSPVGPAIAISPDGSRIAWAASSNDGSAIFTRRLQDPKSVRLASTEGAIAPFFSPDGRWIGFFAGNNIKTISVDGGASVTVCDVGAAQRGGGFWGQDGNIYFAGLRTPVMRVAASGGQAVAVTRLDARKGETSNRAAQLLPGGDALLFEASTDNNRPWDEASILVQSLKTGQRRTLVQAGYFGRYVHGSDPASGHLLYIRNGTLFATPMDLKGLELTGPSVPMLEDVSSRNSNGIADFSISDTGAAVYATGSEVSQPQSLFWFDATGSLQRSAAPAGEYVFPRLSPDGTRIAVTVRDNNGLVLAIYDAARNHLSKLTFARGINDSAYWAPDGKHVVYLARAGNSPGIYWIRADGAGEPQRLLQGAQAGNFSPDGKRMVYLDGADSIWTVALDLADPDHPKAGKPEPFLKSNFGLTNPRFSPDGRWISYISLESGDPYVYVRPFPGPGGKWQVSTTSASLPFWSPKSHELLYRGGGGVMMAVPWSASGDAFQAGQPHPWSTKALPGAAIGASDLTPDGKRMIVALSPTELNPSERLTQLTFLLNFEDELKRRAPKGAK